MEAIMKAISATAMEVACGGLALLDQLAPALVKKGILTERECSQMVKEAITDLRKCGDSRVKKAGDFLETYYKKPVWDRSKRKGKR
jgi:hypothetical protein